MEEAHDRQLRAAAMNRVRDLPRRYDDLIPLGVLREGFHFSGQRISFGSFFSGIFRPRELRGLAALSLVTAPPKLDRPPPYEDTYDENAGSFTYHFREASSDTARAVAQAEADNRTLIAAHEQGVPVIHFRGVAPGQYVALTPVFITAIDSATRTARLEVALPVTDTAGLVSDQATRRYATREAAYRLHQHRFRTAVLLAYRTRCTICMLREAALLQAAHIIGDREERGDATVDNGLALCAIHHLAYDRNLLGIDPEGVVHIQSRLLDEKDGPMLANGLQHFHGAQILQPSRSEDRPDPERLALRFERFSDAA